MYAALGAAQVKQSRLHPSCDSSHSSPHAICSHSSAVRESCVGMRGRWWTPMWWWQQRWSYHAYRCNSFRGTQDPQMNADYSKLWLHSRYSWITSHVMWRETRHSCSDPNISICAKQRCLNDTPGRLQKCKKLKTFQSLFHIRRILSCSCLSGVFQEYSMLFLYLLGLFPRPPEWKMLLQLTEELLSGSTLSPAALPHELFCLLLNFSVKERVRMKWLQCLITFCLYHKLRKEMRVLWDYRVGILRYPGRAVCVHSSLSHKTPPIVRQTWPWAWEWLNLCSP